MKTHTRVSLLLQFGISAVVFAELPSPRNITVQTLNTNYILKWDWDQGPHSKAVTFTAQYLARFKIKALGKYNWTTVCEATSEHHCDFTAEDLYYFGIWILRVRAQNDLLASSWIQIQFCPDRDAAIGPPSAVVVSPVKGLLQVAISDPLTNKNASMKMLLQHMYYYIQYWKDPLEIQKPSSLRTTNNLVILPDLESRTWYCVRVQSRYDFYDKISVFSPTYCEQTDCQMSYWQIFLYFLLSLALSFLFVLGLSFCFLKSFKVIKNTFYPSIPLPTHIQEYLCDSPGSDMPHLLTTDSEVELCCDQLDVLTSDALVKDVVMEIHAPPQDSEQDSRNYSRHNSGDSGVYSAEEGSGQSGQAFKGGEELKLEKMGQISFQKEGRVEPDERIQDMHV
ncbi:interferon alpha/beta receptor 1a-like isoform X2 [Colossoma macropomum]|uniref:interferon alpha/beta receptor 1a-like isoform X2 n=1 Tax=Colossoma macropomum TaxID=42526 RepID=UPI0018646934|nr:interferon alpha/beta receptor 1a-like isoform X2 [Colossoma macropomum]